MSAFAARRRLRLDVVFIISSLLLRGTAGAEDTHGFVPRREAHYQQTQSNGMPDDDFSLLVNGMVLVIEDPRQRICKDRQRFVE
jgi:hypothetical protein